MLEYRLSRCEHWDVNNENLHEQFFEDHTGDHQITQKMFQAIHELDPEPTLFINDYYIMSEEPTAIVSDIQWHTTFYFIAIYFKKGAKDLDKRFARNTCNSCMGFFQFISMCSYLCVSVCFLVSYLF